jgi:dynein light chain 1
LKKWEDTHPENPLNEAVEVHLYNQSPPLEKMDANLNSLANCQKLSLSTNAIDKIFPLNLENLRILSLGRNALKKIGGLEGLPNLQELWLSYNQISLLDGLDSCHNLECLLLSHNKIANLSELSKLKANPKLSRVAFNGCPIFEGLTFQECQQEVTSRVESVTSIDGRHLSSVEDQSAADTSSGTLGEPPAL